MIEESALKSSIWVKLCVIHGPEFVRESLKNFLTMISTISGLTAGFNYIFIGQEIAFKKEGWISSDDRSDLIILFSGMAFISSMTSMMTSAIIVGYVNTSTTYELSESLKTLGTKTDISLTLLIFSIVNIYISGTIWLGGNSSTWPWMIIITLGIISIPYSFYYRSVVRSNFHSKVDNLLRIKIAASTNNKGEIKSY